MLCFLVGAIIDRPRAGQAPPLREHGNDGGVRAGHDALIVPWFIHDPRGAIRGSLVAELLGMTGPQPGRRFVVLHKSGAGGAGKF